MTRQPKQYAWKERQKNIKLIVLIQEQLFLSPTPASIHSLSPTQPQSSPLIAPIELLMSRITKKMRLMTYTGSCIIPNLQKGETEA